MKLRKKNIAFIVISTFFYMPCSIGSCANLSINEAIDMAIENNLEIKQSETEIYIAMATLKAAKAKNSISIGITGNIRMNQNKETSKASTSSGDISIKLPIYSGGKLSAEIDNANLEVISSHYKLIRKMENIRHNIIKAYYDVLEAEKRVNVDQEAVDNYKAHLINVEQLYNAGSKAKIDVLRSSVELSNAQQNLIKSQNKYEINICNLKNILCIDQNEPLTLKDDFSYEPFSPNLETCINFAMKNRKDLWIAENTVNQKKLSIKSANADYLPQVNLSISGNGSHEFSPYKHDGHGYTASISASWDIFDSGLTQSAVDKAKAAYQNAKITFEKNKNDIDLSVRNAYLSMREAEKRFSYTTSAIGQAEEDYFISREKYRAGEGIMLDIIDAQLALSTAKLNHISAQYDYARYKATVENEMGLYIYDVVEEAIHEFLTNNDTNS